MHKEIVSRIQSWIQGGGYFDDRHNIHQGITRLSQYPGSRAANNRISNRGWQCSKYIKMHKSVEHWTDNAINRKRCLVQKEDIADSDWLSVWVGQPSEGCSILHTVLAGASVIARIPVAGCGVHGAGHPELQGQAPQQCATDCPHPL